jgi:hypothetical protein
MRAALLVDAHDFTVETLAGLVAAGYARVVPGTIRARCRKTKDVRMQITEAGRRVLLS